MSSETPAHEADMLPRITEAEWKVMTVFWEIGEATLREVVAALEDGGPDWKSRTVQSLIRRLVNKGALKSTKQGRDFLYSAAVDRTECEVEESRSFLGRVFEGRLVPFVSGMVENEEVSRDEIDELRRLLDEAADRQISKQDRKETES